LGSIYRGRKMICLFVVLAIFCVGFNL